MGAVLMWSLDFFILLCFVLIVGFLIGRFVHWG